jgi:hypothetical protein
MGPGAAAHLPDPFQVLKPALGRRDLVAGLAIQRKAPVAPMDKHRRLRLIASDLSVECQ